MSTKKKTPAKKTTTRRRTVKPLVVEEPQNEGATPSLSPDQQAAVDMENARLSGFMSQMQMQYLQGRVGELTTENVQLRETIETLQRRLQKYEDEANA